MKSEKHFEKYWQSIIVPPDDQRDWTKDKDELINDTNPIIDVIKLHSRKSFIAGWKAREDNL